MASHPPFAKVPQTWTPPSMSGIASTTITAISGVSSGSSNINPATQQALNPKPDFKAIARRALVEEAVRERAVGIAKIRNGVLHTRRLKSVSEAYKESRLVLAQQEEVRINQEHEEKVQRLNGYSGDRQANLGDYASSNISALTVNTPTGPNDALVRFGGGPTFSENDFTRLKQLAVARQEEDEKRYYAHTTAHFPGYKHGWE